MNEILSADDADWSFGDGDFTIEGFFRIDTRPLALCRSTIYFQVLRYRENQ